MPTGPFLTSPQTQFWDSLSYPSVSTSWVLTVTFLLPLPVFGNRSSGAVPMNQKLSSLGEGFLLWIWDVLFTSSCPLCDPVSTSPTRRLPFWPSVTVRSSFWVHSELTVPVAPRPTGVRGPRWRSPYGPHRTSHPLPYRHRIKSFLLPSLKKVFLVLWFTLNSSGPDSDSLPVGDVGSQMVGTS